MGNDHPVMMAKRYIRLTLVIKKFAGSGGKSQKILICSGGWRQHASFIRLLNWFLNCLKTERAAFIEKKFVSFLHQNHNYNGCSYSSQRIRLCCCHRCRLCLLHHLPWFQGTLSTNCQLIFLLICPLCVLTLVFTFRLVPLAKLPRSLTLTVSNCF